MNQPDQIRSRLNDRQRQVVLDESPVTLVNAQVGSGKTTVLIAKIFYQHVVRHIPLRDLVVLTFTNKAAQEIRERMMAAGTGVKEEDMPWFGTFHGVAMLMLQKLLPVEELGYTPDFTILNPDELPELASGLIAAQRLRIKYVRKLAQRLDAYRSGQVLYGVMKQPDDIGRLWEGIKQEKKAQNKMDFDDLMLYATRLLQKGSFIPKWIIVDELQDCDGLQLDFIHALKGPETRLFAVGDPNQVIYSWRGSQRNIFSQFKEQYQAGEMALPVNYRSCSSILEIAGCFLENRAVLEGVRERGKPVTICNHYNPFMEADSLAGKIKELHASGLPYRQVAVLYRLQRQSQSLENIFQKEGIPYEVSVRKSLKDIPVLQWMVRLLNASVNPRDQGSLIAVLTDVHFGEGLTPKQARDVIAGKRGSVLSEKISGFAGRAAGLRTADDLWHYYRLDDWLLPTSAVFQENKNQVLALLHRLEQAVPFSGSGMVPGIKDFLNSLALSGLEPFREGQAGSGDAVQLMTLHACKGLEFRQVFIIGVNEGLIPLRSSVGRTNDPEAEDEEKRLFFVGITRAMDGLELSWYTSPDDPRVYPGESHYLSMIPRHLIEFAGDDTPGEEVDLQAFRRKILENREQERGAGNPVPEERRGGTPVPDGPPTPADQPEYASANSGAACRRVSHPRYGEGVIEAEDEGSYTVSFEHYGLKAFSKDFCPLVFL